MYTLEQQQSIEKANLLKAIANPIRLCIIRKLIANEECSVSFFQNCLETSQSSISQHLGKLKDVGIVSVRKEGTSAYYSLVNVTVRNVVINLFKEYKDA